MLSLPVWVGFGIFFVSINSEAVKGWVMPEKADLEADVVDAIYRGACDRAEFTQALERLRRLVDGAAAVLGETEFGRPGVSDLIAVGALDETIILTRYAPF